MGELLAIYKELATDDLDSVRVAALSSLSPLMTCLSKDVNKTTMLSIIIQSAEDKSWKIRSALAEVFPNIVTAMPKDLQEMNLIGIFTNLLRDNENEVKLNALRSLLLF
jgi:serine/threonine-protein phosphatase 2A regulatory subunit A